MFNSPTVPITNVLLVKILALSRYMSNRFVLLVNIRGVRARNRYIQKVDSAKNPVTAATP